MPGISIITATTQGRSDGYSLRHHPNGRGLMPTYNRIEEMDRWDVVNYVRALQGRIPNTAGLGAVGLPGADGEHAAGYTATAPTRPAPHWRDARGPWAARRLAAGRRPPHGRPPRRQSQGPTPGRGAPGPQPRRARRARAHPQQPDADRRGTP
jgi:hypothetical protein